MGGHGDGVAGGEEGAQRRRGGGRGEESPVYAPSSLKEEDQKQVVYIKTEFMLSVAMRSTSFIGN